jgi:nitroimidazol reductase NimA-like FMN-containing flavoprotein (pyridoxamine 5'-phosphate oxidase superfamily)
MTSESEAQTVERIGRDECMLLLKSRTVGRVGLKRADDIAVLPVFYAVVGDGIVFRTAPGSKLDAAVMKSRVAFEVDNGSPPWSVLLHGYASEIHARSPAAEARAQLGSDWPAGQRERLVRISIDDISGRRLMPVHVLRADQIASREYGDAAERHDRTRADEHERSSHVD